MKWVRVMSVAFCIGGVSVFGLTAKGHYVKGVVISSHKSVDEVWQATQQLEAEWQKRQGTPNSTLVWRLEDVTLRRLLEANKKNKAKTQESGETIISLPMTDGTLHRFRVKEAPMKKPGLAARFPEIKSYRGWGVDNPALTMRCDLSPPGFHAMVTNGAELIAIHPVSRDDQGHYVSYASRDYQAAAKEARCLVNAAAGNSASLTLMAHELGHQFGATHTQNADCGARGRHGV